jgi:hypothetical protein
MTQTPDEDGAWSPDRDADSLIGDLRQQLDTAKARMRDLRDGMEATGRTSSSDGEASAG